LGSHLFVIVVVGSESSNAGSLHRQLVKELREMASFFVATWRMRMELYGVRALKRWLNASLFTLLQLLVTAAGICYVFHQ
jgi:hypothetical protein